MVILFFSALNSYGFGDVIYKRSLGYSDSMQLLTELSVNYVYPLDIRFIPGVFGFGFPVYKGFISSGFLKRNLYDLNDFINGDTIEISNYKYYERFYASGGSDLYTFFLSFLYKGFELYTGIGLVCTSVKETWTRIVELNEDYFRSEDTIASGMNNIAVDMSFMYSFTKDVKLYSGVMFYTEGKMNTYILAHYDTVSHVIDTVALPTRLRLGLDVYNFSFMFGSLFKNDLKSNFFLNMKMNTIESLILDIDFEKGYWNKEKNIYIWLWFN